VKLHMVLVAPDTMLVFDRGYADHNWWLQLTRQQVHFVTRLKDSGEYGIVEQRPAPEGGNVLRDEVVLLCSQQDVGPEARLRRLVGTTENAVQTRSGTASRRFKVRLISYRSFVIVSTDPIFAKCRNLTAPLR